MADLQIVHHSSANCGPGQHRRQTTCDHEGGTSSAGHGVPHDILYANLKTCTIHQGISRLSAAVLRVVQRARQDMIGSGEGAKTAILLFSILEKDLTQHPSCSRTARDAADDPLQNRQADGSRYHPDAISGGCTALLATAHARTASSELVASWNCNSFLA